ncbi:hypothetical protein OZX69_03690 [Lactobacillus sp. ESL0731]|uniref:hypothetical protein n=1 Tax=unclassified Lactobacillus TaxID=2620435 RepID=UPI0023F8AE6C|nr:MULTISPECIES: hypothetical protein [unclassified Lactobacillus]WEV51812.1 hypothetical protein OZX63_03690 [Lactobacillus sp. ESL0700]WEV62941.1 hypothetical protein OZX69_03690 [Lactobacillus sp. ESL0731]
MKKIARILLRAVFIVAICLCGYWTLKSPVTVNVIDVRELAKTVVDKNASASGNAALKDALKLAESAGLEDKVLGQLPKQYHHNLSYVGLYNLSVTYEANGELTAKNLSLPQKNKTQQAVNRIILHDVNHELADRDKQVEQIINIFHYVILVIILGFVLAALLVLFGKYAASIALLLTTLGSFGILQYCTGQLVMSLRSALSTGISFTTSAMLWAALILGVIAAILWPICLKLAKKR